MERPRRSFMLPFPMARESAVLGLVLLVAVGAALAPTLDVGFVFDDRGDVLDNPAASPEGFVAALGRTNRPLLKGSYALQRATTGAAARPFHAVNLALHLGCTLLAFGLARRLARSAGVGRPEWMGAFAAAVWALHPAAVEAVAPVTGRSVLLSTLLLLAALLLVTAERPPGPAAAGLAAGLALAAPLARETALVLPVLALAWQATLRAGENRAAALRRQLPLLVGALAAMGALALSARQRELVAFSLAVRPPLEALRGNVSAVFHIVRLWLEPGRISVDPAPPADLAWGAPTTLLRLAFLATIAAFAVLARRRLPLAAFACAWALLALAPTNSILWRLDPVSARPLYLATLVPLVALAVGMSKTIPGVARRGSPEILAPARRAIAAAGCLVLLLTAGSLAHRSHERARLFTDPAALWSDAAAKAPDRARPWQNLGIELMLAERLDPAARALERALELDPAASSARCALTALRIRQRTNELFERRTPE